MSLISNLKKQREESLKKAAEGLSNTNGGGGGKREKDPTYWTLERDEQGNAAAIIRFLPNVHEGDELPWVKVDRYAFKGPTGKWYVNNSLSTLGKPDPVKEDNSRLWNEVGTEEAKNIARSRKIQPKHTFNIYVIKDVNHPENEGKVFKFDAGKQIFGWIEAQAKPEEDALGDTPDPVYVWDLWEGANFRFKCYTEGPYPKYDKSSFDAKSAFLGGDEDAIEAVLKQCHKLSPLLDPSNFKDYDTLKKELDRAMGTGGGPAPAKQSSEPSKANSIDDDAAAEPAKKEPAKKAAPKKADPAPAGDVDDSMAYFQSLIGD